MGKAIKNFNSASLDILGLVNKNGAIKIDRIKLEESSDIYAYDSKALNDEMIKSLFRGGYLTLKRRWTGRDGINWA